MCFFVSELKNIFFLFMFWEILATLVWKFTFYVAGIILSQDKKRKLEKKAGFVLNKESDPDGDIIVNILY